MIRQTTRPRRGFLRAAQMAAGALGPTGVVAFALMLGACSEIVPQFELRDDYMFKRFIQPNRVVGDVERDELGNPIVPEAKSE